MDHNNNQIKVTITKIFDDHVDDDIDYEIIEEVIEYYDVIEEEEVEEKEGEEKYDSIKQPLLLIQSPSPSLFPKIPFTTPTACSSYYYEEEVIEEEVILEDEVEEEGFHPSSSSSSSSSPPNQNQPSVATSSTAITSSTITASSSSLSCQKTKQKSKKSAPKTNKKKEEDDDGIINTTTDATDETNKKKKKKKKKPRSSSALSSLKSTGSLLKDDINKDAADDKDNKDQPKPMPLRRRKRSKSMSNVLDVMGLANNVVKSNPPLPLMSTTVPPIVIPLAGTSKRDTKRKTLKSSSNNSDMKDDDIQKKSQAKKKSHKPKSSSKIRMDEGVTTPASSTSMEAISVATTTTTTSDSGSKLNATFINKPKSLSTLNCPVVDDDEENCNMSNRKLRPGRKKKNQQHSAADAKTTPTETTPLQVATRTTAKTKAKMKSKSSPGLITMAAAAFMDRRTKWNAKYNQEEAAPPPPAPTTSSPLNKPSSFVWNNKEHLLNDWDSDCDDDEDGVLLRDIMSKKNRNPLLMLTRQDKAAEISAKRSPAALSRRRLIQYVPSSSQPTKNHADTSNLLSSTSSFPSRAHQNVGGIPTSSKSSMANSSSCQEYQSLASAKQPVKMENDHIFDDDDDGGGGPYPIYKDSSRTARTVDSSSGGSSRISRKGRKNNVQQRCGDIGAEPITTNEESYNFSNPTTITSPPQMRKQKKKKKCNSTSNILSTSQEKTRNRGKDRPKEMTTPTIQSIST
jgi:hypothetical protein